MSAHRAVASLSGHVRAALVRAVLMTMLIVVTYVVLVTASSMTAREASTTTLGRDSVAGAVQSLMREHRCSTQGFAEIPGSALLLHRGQLRQVTFERGWAAYEGTRPGLLVAVCRSQVRR